MSAGGKITVALPEVIDVVSGRSEKLLIPLLHVPLGNDLEALRTRTSNHSFPRMTRLPRGTTNFASEGSLNEAIVLLLKPDLS